MIRSAIRHTTEFVVKAGAARASRAGAVLLLLMGCATVGAAPTGRGTVCVPPGLPPIDQWVYQQGRPVAFVNDQFRPVIAVQTLYAVNSRPIGAYWLNGALLMVDTDPTDAAAPALYDWGLMDALGRLRADGKPYCEWKPVAHSETTRLRTETARN